MTFRELLIDQGIDPELLLEHEVGTKLEGGGITARLEDGVLDLHVLVEKGALPKPKAKRRSKTNA